MHKMHTISILLEVADARHPEEMNTLETMEMKIEDQTALTFHRNFGHVKIINVEAHPSYDAFEDSLSHLPQTTSDHEE